jgi:AraC family transcriptional activator of pyochelin receptor
LEQIQTYKQGVPQGLKPAEIARLQELKAYIDANFLQEMSLIQLSRLSLLNEFKLKKGFKEQYGTTVFGYIRDLKMRYAAGLLHQSVPVSDIAFELGYEQAHHFSVAFKQYMGVSPREFKKAGRH